jgi:hypothetical protein
MATLQPAFAEATACQAKVLTTDRPTPSAFVSQSRDYGVIDFTDDIKKMTKSKCRMTNGYASLNR